MNKTNLKPLAWGLLGAGVAVMGTAGALDLPSWLRHSSAVTTPGAGGKNSKNKLTHHGSRLWRTVEQSKNRSAGQRVCQPRERSSIPPA